MKRKRIARNGRDGGPGATYLQGSPVGAFRLARQRRLEARYDVAPSQRGMRHEVHHHRRHGGGQPVAVQRLHHSPEPAGSAAISETLRAIRFRPDLPRRPGDPAGRRDREGPAGVAKTGFCGNRRSPGAVDDPALHGRGNGKPGHAGLPERASPGVVFPKARGADGGGGRAIRGADELPGRPLGSQRRHAPGGLPNGDTPWTAR